MLLSLLCPRMRWLFMLLAGIALAVLTACAPQAPKNSPGHLNQSNLPPPPNDIPPPIAQMQMPPLPPPTPATPPEKYTIVVDEVPATKLLFALAREANYNIDIHPEIKGSVSINAIEQTLTQILERLSNQLDIAYEVEGDYIRVFPDEPILRTYKVGYVNMSRTSTGEVSVATQVAKTGSVDVGTGASADLGGNNSTTTIKNEAEHALWQRLEENIQAILDGNAKTGQNTKNNVIINPEGGVLTILATRRQHIDIADFLDKVTESVQKQVLIEATIAEVRLGDQYQAGIDWQRIDGDFSYIQRNIDASLSNTPFYAINYANPNSVIGDISGSVRMLEEFGSVKVLSSPKLMVLNNQTAILKVVDNLVYFTVDVEITEGTLTNVGRTTYETQVSTVPVGLVMSVTPQIGDDDVVTLNVRPTISRVLNYKQDPNPLLAEAGVVNAIPEIQVREIESILKVNNRDIAVIGGLMQDDSERNTSGVPVLSKLPVVGDLFSYRDDQYNKTELVIFLRPVVIKNASLEGDLSPFKNYLPNPQQPDNSSSTGFMN